MALRRLFPVTLAAAGLVLALITLGLGLVLTHPAARALPPAGTENVYVTADVSVASRIGTETIHVTGIATIVRQDPHLESGREVENLQITSLSLAGTSMEGPITVSQSGTTNSTGQIRSINLSPSQFPATSFFDVFFEAAIPASGFGSPSPFVVHNDVAVHLVAMSNITSWPPYGVTYTMQPNAAPTPTPSPTPTPTPAASPPPGTPPCPSGVLLLPELPGEICVTAVSLTLSVAPTPTPSPTLTPTATPCVPTCTPTPTSTGPAATSTRTPFPSPTPTHTPGPFAPADTVFSVGPHGPSGFHPADLLERGASTVPIAVSGNDNFANAWQISGSPFSGTESTVGMTTEQGEPLTSANPSPSCIPTTPFYEGATVWFRFSPSASGTVNVDTTNSDYDTVLAVYTGSALNALTLVACDDDTATSLQSAVSFSATGGTTYYIQAGGFAGAVGNLVLHVTGPGSAGVSGVHVAIPCTALGLSAAGCGATGPQDNVDALSFGHDFASGTAAVWFSVAPGSTGMTGSGVALQAACSPPGPQADLFSSSRDGANALLVDGDGAVDDGCPTTAAGLNLIERPTSDNVDAISGAPISAVDTNGDGRLDNPVFFALSQGSPSLATLGRGAADILWTVGFQPGVYASSTQLGLQPTDGIDGLCVSHPGDGATYDPARDRVLFSLAPGSPTLAALGASPADVLAPGPKIAIHAWELGLQPTDSLDALHCFAPAGGAAAVTVPVGDFYFCNQSYQGGVCDTVVHVGDTVTWNFTATDHHTSTECGASCDNPTSQPLWDSGPISSLDPVHTFSQVFNTPGTYLYYCRIHPTAQRGRIIVQAVGNPTATPTPARIYGDANKDGVVDAIDAAIVLQYSAGLLPSINQNADANGDGQINAIDATLILQYVAGLLSHLPP